MIRVLICDDQAVVREGLAALLAGASTLHIVGLAQHGREALDMVPMLDPDVVLMDLHMPTFDGVKATRLIREQYPEVAVLVLTTYDSDDWLRDAIEAGAAGYLLKDTRRDELIKAIEGTAQGATHLDPQIAGQVMAWASEARGKRGKEAELSPEDCDLTARECDILALIAQGKSNPEIGGILRLSAGTVRNYVSRIFVKLDISDRAQAAALAVRLGL